jgi:hypothetical protein
MSDVGFSQQWDVVADEKRRINYSGMVNGDSSSESSSYVAVCLEKLLAVFPFPLVPGRSRGDRLSSLV